ncbi:MAG TPA: HlyD family efflux transporter periplasmic adaptor subunit [Falsiroseomonas sp.]|nr:HlyD family efflux transporter periplasmic adaptor subunit [Falsiroseomonas sp.]
MRRGTKILLALLVAAAVLAAGGWSWWQGRQARLPEGIAVGNGRLEAEQVDLATKYAGRIMEILVREGEMVEAGQILARMDSAEVEAQLRQAEAETRRFRRSVEEALAQLEQRRGEATLAARNLDRTLRLAAQGHSPQQTVDRQRTEARSAGAARDAAERHVEALREAVQAAQAAADRLGQQIEETALRAPRTGRVQYRLAQPGEVLAPGGKLLTILDLTDVHMTIFLPARAAGRLSIGADARLVLDAGPETPLPGRVSFVAAQAQFTPRQVETREERENLMYRVRVKLPPALLRRYEDQVKVGITGLAYVRLDPDLAWPASLQSRLTEPDWWSP